MLNESNTSLEVDNFIVDFLDLLTSSNNQNFHNIKKIINTQLASFKESNPHLELANVVNTDGENCN